MNIARRNYVASLGQLGQLGLGQTIGGWDIGDPIDILSSASSQIGHARFRARDAAGLSAFLVSALARLPSIGRSISFWPAAAFRGFLPFAADSGAGLFFSASINSTTFSPRGRGFGPILLAWRFVLMSSVSASS